MHFVGISLTKEKLQASRKKTDVFDLRRTKNHDQRYFIFSLKNANTLEPIREMRPNKMEKKMKN